MEQQRVFLAIALSLGVLFLWQYFFMPQPQMHAPTGADAGVVAPAGSDEGQPALVKPNGGDAAAATPAEPVQPEKVVELNESLSLKTESFEATFTNRGGRLKSFKILKPEQYAPRGDLIKPVDKGDEPVGDTYLKYLSFGMTGDLPGLNEETMFEVVSASEDALVLKHEIPGAYTVEKRFLLDAESPDGFRMSVAVTNDSSGPMNHTLGLRFYAHSPEGDGDFSIFDPLPDITEGLCFIDGEDERVPRTDLEDPLEPFKGPTTWGGVDSRYFIMAAINKEEAIHGCDFALMEKAFIRSTLHLAPLVLAPGQKHIYNFENYVGPKLVEKMEMYDVRLEESVDYGIFAFLCRPIRYLLVLFQGWVINWGIAIILLTFVLRMLLFPINHSAYKNMEGMRRIQEPMKAMREKYKDDPMKMQEQLMKMYKDEGVSPFGCLPQLLQIPIFFALYRTIYSSVELYNASFYFWYVDLSAPDPYFVLPILVGLLMVGQQMMMPTTATNPQMKYIMWSMPVMFAAFTFVLPSGLGLYLFVSIGLGISQQYFIRKSHSKNDDKATA
jgi:YidC/Oxa1 family membrane protein insertase